MSHIEPICKQLNILKLKDIYHFRCFKLIKSWQLNLLPSTLAQSFSTVNASNLRSHRFKNNLVIPNYRLQSSCSHVFHFGARLFNNLPEKFKCNILSLAVSSKHYKKYIIDNYSYLCPNLDSNCPVCCN